MHVSGPRSVQETALAAANAIKKSIDVAADMSEEDKNKAKKAIDETTFVASEVPNTFVYWLAVGAVSLIAIIIVIGTFYLSNTGQETPNFLQMALATAIGALAGMVVPTPKTGV